MIILHAHTMFIVHACAMIKVHECTMIIVHACAMIIVQACTMIIVHALHAPRNVKRQKIETTLLPKQVFKHIQDIIARQFASCIEYNNYFRTSVM